MKSKGNFGFMGALLVLFAMLYGGTAAAQWAGPDQRVVRKSDNTQTVTLSVLQVDPNACYTWSGPNIQGDADQPSVTANPQNDEQTYICKRISATGVDEDAVLVTLIDTVRIVSVKPIKNCFQTGDAVSTDQFKIVTDPTGYESQVTVSPNTISGAWLSADSKVDVPLTFSLTVEGVTHTKEATVEAINPDMGTSLSLGTDIEKVVENIRKYDEISKEMETLSEKMKAVDGLAKIGVGVEVKRPKLHFGAINLTVFNYACCHDKVIETLPFSWDGGYVEGGVSCTVPFPIACIPGLSFYLSFEAMARLGLGPFNVTLSNEKGCTTVDLNGMFSVTVSGAAGICALSPSILSAQLGLEGQGSVGFKWSIVPFGFDFNPLTVKASVVGKATTFGLINKEVRWTFAEWVF